MFNELKPNLDELHLNLERMKQEMQHNTIKTEIENRIIHFAPSADESVIL